MSCTILCLLYYPVLMRRMVPYTHACSAYSWECIRQYSCWVYLSCAVGESHANIQTSTAMNSIEVHESFTCIEWGTYYLNQYYQVVQSTFPTTTRQFITTKHTTNKNYICYNSRYVRKCNNAWQTYTIFVMVQSGTFPMLARVLTITAFHNINKQCQ